MSCLAGIAALIGGSAQASVEFKHAVINNHPLKAVIEKYGGRVHIKAKCKNDFVAVFYPMQGGQIVICSERSTTATQLEEALTHEAVHFAQHCYGAEGGSIYITQELKKHAAKKGFSDDAEYAHKMAKLYTDNTHDYNREFEAYYFEDSPGAVSDMIKESCSDFDLKEI